MFKCGAWGVGRLIKLAKRCEEKPNKDGRLVLNRSMLNKTPWCGMKAWPTEAPTETSDAVQVTD